MLLSFLKQSLGPEQDAAIRKRLVRQIWYGVGAGMLICLIICAGVIGTCTPIHPFLASQTTQGKPPHAALTPSAHVVYTAGKNSFEAAEYIWEGVFGILASLIITLMGAALLRVSKLQDKWRVKISKVLEQKDTKLPIKGRVKAWSEKYAMFVLPFITVLREGIEAVL